MITIDYKDKRPLFEQVTDKLKKLIFIGVLPSDSQLPSVRALAVELSITPNTIARAYHQLESEGFIFTVKGKGCFVAPKDVVVSLKETDYYKTLKAAIAEGRQAGFSKSKVLALAKQITEEVYND